MYYVAPQETIEGVLTDKITKISSAVADLPELFKAAHAADSYTAKFSVLDKGKVAQKIFWDILRDRPKSVQIFWPVRDMLASIAESTFAEWYKERIARQIHARILWPYKQKVNYAEHNVLGSGNTAESLREVRILPKGVDASMAYMIYGHKVAYLSSERENYGFIVDSAELAELASSQFEFLWKLSKRDS